MVIPRWSVAPLEEALLVGGTTTARSTRATSPHVATMNKKYNSPLATCEGQGIKAKIHLRPTFMTIPQSTSGRRSMKAATRGLLLKGGEWTVPVGATMMTTATASPPSQPAASTSPTQRTSNQSESPSTMVSRTRASGFDTTPLPLKFQGDPTPPKLSTSRWLWSPHPSRGLKASSHTPSTRGRTSSGPSSTTSRDP
jgi:hypothetical protein